MKGNIWEFQLMWFFSRFEMLNNFVFIRYRGIIMTGGEPSLFFYQLARVFCQLVKFCHLSVETPRPLTEIQNLPSKIPALLAEATDVWNFIKNILP